MAIYGYSEWIHVSFIFVWNQDGRYDIIFANFSKRSAACSMFFAKSYVGTHVPENPFGLNENQEWSFKEFSFSWTLGKIYNIQNIPIAILLKGI